MDEDRYKYSYLSSHLYKTFYFKTTDKSLVSVFAKEFNVSMSKKTQDKIYELSGGINRITKYLVTNISKSNKLPEVNELIEDFDLIRAITPTVSVIKRCSDADLERLGIKNKGEFTSLLLSKYFEIENLVNKFDIKINRDMTLSEAGQDTNIRLNKVERDILIFMMENEGVISKEKVAEFKWGEGSYDKFSDQAIGKSIQRLRKKLKKHKIKVIPKVGYELVAVR